MIQLKILSGGKAGTNFVTREFPFVIGRSPGAQLRLEEPGVWDQHLRVELSLQEGFALRVQPSALASVNGEACQSTRLRNGDLIEIGSVKLQFWLSEVDQPSTVWRERCTWIFLAGAVLVQLGLIFWLIR
jgi:hypothetical protein